MPIGKVIASDSPVSDSVTGKRYEDHLREAGFNVEPPIKNQGRGIDGLDGVADLCCLPGSHSSEIG
jgi:hypothetical protein